MLTANDEDWKADEARIVGDIRNDEDPPDPTTVRADMDAFEELLLLEAAELLESTSGKNAIAAALRQANSARQVPDKGPRGDGGGAAGADEPDPPAGDMEHDEADDARPDGTITPPTPALPSPVKSPRTKRKRNEAKPPKNRNNQRLKGNQLANALTQRDRVDLYRRLGLLRLAGGVPWELANLCAPAEKAALLLRTLKLTLPPERYATFQAAWDTAGSWQTSFTYNIVSAGLR